MFKRSFLIGVFAIGVLILPNCGGSRKPTPKSAQSITQGYFKGYSKKFKTSLIGKSPVQKVEINQVFERSRNLAEIDAFLNLKGGEVARVVVTTRKNPPFGWTVSSWELLDLR